jgi:hypothetical protein
MMEREFGIQDVGDHGELKFWKRLVVVRTFRLVSNSVSLMLEVIKNKGRFHCLVL